MKSYTNSVYYSIRLTSRYFNTFLTQLLKKFKSELTVDEIFALDILRNNGSMCQRDLAKLILKDRANTGKIVSGLEKKGYINIKAVQKNNRLIKELSILQKGIDFLDELWINFEPTINKISEKFSREDDNKIQDILKTLRETLSEVMEIQI